MNGKKTTRSIVSSNKSYYQPVPYMLHIYTNAKISLFVAENILQN